VQKIKADEMVEGKFYHYISAISGEAGVGRVSVKIENGKREYWYLYHCNGTTEYCTPCKLSRFVEASSGR
jgi:uncharacterized protein YbcV (DUF1398 family)